MKKSVISSYKIVPEKEVSPMAQSADPANSGRVPLNTILTAERDLRFVPATGTMTKPWQAVIGTNGDDSFTISPRVFLGYAYVGEKLVQVSERNLPKKPLIDLLKGNLKFRVLSYESVQVDNFTTKELEAKDFPMIEIITDEVAEVPVAPKVAKPKNNAKPAVTA